MKSATATAVATIAKLSLLALLAGLALVLSDAPAHAAPSLAEQRRALSALLHAHEYRPTRSLLDRIGPDVNQALVHISGDSKVNPTIRIRAVASLALYPSLRTRHFLEGLLYDRGLSEESAGMLILRQSLLSLARAFREAAIHSIAPFQTSSDPQLREACAHALGQTGSLRALPLLEGWLPHEPELQVRTAIDRSILGLIRRK